MVITDGYLKEIAKAMSGESFNYATYNAFSSTLTTENIADTSLAGEYGSRLILTTVRSDNVVTYSSTKTGAIVSTSGEAVKGLGLLSASSGGILMTETAIPTINQTNAFDVEFITQITYTRPS